MKDRHAGGNGADLPRSRFLDENLSFGGYFGGILKTCPSRIAAMGLLRGQLRFDTSGEGCPRNGSQGLLRAKAFSCWFYKG